MCQIRHAEFISVSGFNRFQNKFRMTFKQQLYYEQLLLRKNKTHSGFS